MGEHGTWFDYLNRFSWWIDFNHWAEGKLGRTAGTKMFASGFSLTHVLITLIVVAFVAWGALAFFRGLKSADKGIVPPPQPPLGPGLAIASPAAGEIFPQPLAGEGGGSVPHDDLLGPRFTLISRATVPAVVPAGITAIRAATLGTAAERWLEERGVDAALVRPDRYVFGTGAPAVLLAELTRRLGVSP